MTRSKAIELIKEYYNEPIWCVKVGMGSNQVEGVDFDEAVTEFDRCNKNFHTEYLEYVYIYCKNYIVDCNEIYEALDVLGFGYGRRKRELTNTKETK